MGLIDKIKSLFVASDLQLLESEGKLKDIQVGKTLKTDAIAESKENISLIVPEELTAETVLNALIDYGKAEGYCQSADNTQEIGAALIDSVKNQIIRMHEEILKYYQKKNQTPDEKLLNLLTVENIFFLSMGSAILAKVKKSNLIAQGIFVKLLKKSGPDLFYREVLAMAGHKYGSESAENLHKHIQRASYLLLIKADASDNTRGLVIEIARAMYLYALRVTLK